MFYCWHAVRSVQILKTIIILYYRQLYSPLNGRNRKKGEKKLNYYRLVPCFRCQYAVLVYKCLHGSAPAYLMDELYQVADVEARQRLRSSSSSSLIVSRTRLSIPSVTELFRSPLLASGTVCLILSLPHLPYSCLPVPAQNPHV